MRFIRPRFGIALWCVIALLMLIVPLWRLRAVRQWNFASVQRVLAPDYVSSPILVEGQANPKPTPAPIPYGFTEADQMAAAQRFPGEPVARLARLNVGEVTWRVNAILNGLTQNYFDAKSLAKAKARLKNNNPRVWEVTDAYFAHYDELERRFPASALVRAQHLRDISGMAYFSDPATDSAMYPAGSLALKYEPPASKQALQNAIQASREGARLQPKNAFFPWMESLFQFSLERPNEALRALEAAGRCADFDDYTFRNIEERTQLMKRLRTTGWEDDVAEQATALFPHYARMRSTARAASWQMQLARKRKDKAAEFRWAAALTSAAYPVARSERNSIICVLVGDAICKVSWRAAVQGEPNAPKTPEQGTPPPQRERDYEEFYKNNADLFARIARANGNDALARQTLAVSASLNGRELSQLSQTDPGGLETLSFRLSIFYWLGAQLLRISLGGALIWFVCWSFTRRLPIVAKTRAKMLLPAMFLSGVTGAILVGAALISPSLYGLLAGFYENPTEDKTFWMIAVLRDRWPLMLGVLWGVLVFGGAIGSAARAHTESNENSLRGWRDVILWAICVLCLTPIFYFYLDFKPANFVSDFVVYGVSLALISLSITASFASIRRSAGLKRVLTACLICVFWTGFVLPLVASFLFPDSLDPLFWFVVAAFVLGASLSSVVLLARGLRSARFSEIAVQIAARARIAAGVLALLGAIAYLGLALWTIPVEAKTRAIIQRQLQIGGAAWLREQIAQK